MFRYIENPIRQHRLLLSRSRLTLALAATLTIVTVGISALARYGAERALRSPEQIAYFQAAETQPAPDGCQRIYFDVDGRTCEFGDRDATWTVALFGDSHATQWVPAFDRLGRERRWRIRLLSKSDCPSVSVELFSSVLQRPYRECQEWRDREFAELNGSPPAMVVVANSDNYTNGPDSPTRVSLSAWQDGTRRTIEKLDRAGAQVVLIRDSPRPGFRVPECLSLAAFSPFSRRDSCGINRNVAVNQAIFDIERQAAASFPRTLLLDLTDAFCTGSTCSPIRDGTVVYQDSSHMTAAFSATLAPLLGRALDAVSRAGERD
jgi:hypothetical protein